MSDLAALRRAASALEPQRVVAALARAIDDWRAPDSPWRAELARRHGGFSREVLELGLRLGLGDWTGAKLTALLAREVREPCWRPELTAVWLAGSIPTACFAALIPPLLAGSAVYAKTAADDPLSAELFAASLRSADPAVGAALGVGSSRDVLHQADAVVAHGRDETLAKIRAALGPATVFVGYGHKLSLAAVGAGAELAAAAAQLATDVALWDGRGCLSPAWALVVESQPGRAEAFARALALELEKAEKELPRGRLTAAEQSGLRDLRSRDAVRDGSRVWQSQGSTAWSVVLSPDAARPPAGSLRRVPVVALSDLEGLCEWCRGLEPHLSCVGHAGFGSEREALARGAAAAGASRLCPLGRMQLPPIDWNHDGQGPIRPLLRLLDIERAEGKSE